MWNRIVCPERIEINYQTFAREVCQLGDSAECGPHLQSLLRSRHQGRHKHQRERRRSNALGCLKYLTRVCPCHPPAEKQISILPLSLHHAQERQSSRHFDHHPTDRAGRRRQQFSHAVEIGLPLLETIRRNFHDATFGAFCHADRPRRVVAYINLKRMPIGTSVTHDRI